jgi:hypothetical protein
MLAAGVAMAGGVSNPPTLALLAAGGGITNAMLAGSIASSKLVGTDITTVGALTAGSIVSGFGSILTLSNVTAAALIPTSSTVPTNGLFLRASNTPNIAANGQKVMDFSSLGTAVNYMVLQSRATGVAPQFYANSDAGLAFGLGAAGTISFNTGVSTTPVTQMTIDDTGAITMPRLTATSAAQAGTICGSTATGGNLTIDTSLGCLASDERLKDIVAPLSDATSKMMALKPIVYRWKDGTPKAGGDPGDHVGLGAFATGYADERLISRDGEGNPRGWRQDAVVALLVAAGQEQQREIGWLWLAVGLLALLQAGTIAVFFVKISRG